MKKSIFFKLILITLVCVVSVKADAELHLLYNSDTHGFIEPCQKCPSNVRGGYSARGYIVDSLRAIHSKSLLVIDGGDFSAGSPYDLESEGIRELDSIRTVISLRAINRIGYDAIGLGENDLAMGVDFLKRKREIYNIPFVSLSYRDSLGNLLGAPFIEKENDFGSIIITSVGVKPDDFILELGYAYQPISASINEFSSNINKDKYSVVFLINHAGEDSLGVIETLLKKNNLLEKTVILNAHKKLTPSYLFHTEEDSVQVVNFDYTSSRLTYAKIDKVEDLLNVDVETIDVLKSLGENRHIKKIVEEFEEIRKNFLLAKFVAVKLDMFIDTDYEPISNVLRDVMPFIVNNQDLIEFTIYYLNKEKIDFNEIVEKPLGEIEDFIFQAALQMVDKDRFSAYLAFRYLHNRTDRYSFMRDVGIDTADVKAVLESRELKKFFKTNKNHIDKFNLDDSDYAILFNGKKMDKFESVFDIQYKICSFYPADFCQDIPGCLDNSHCENRGLTGVCLENKCDFVKDPFFTFNVVGTQKSFSEPDKDFVEVIQELFPSSYIRLKNASDSAVSEMIKEKNIKKLPFYYADKEFKESENFKFFETSFVDAGDYLFLDESHYVPYFELDSATIFGRSEVYININSSVVKEKPMLIEALIDLYSTGRIEKIHFLMPSQNLYSYEDEEVQRAQFIHDSFSRSDFGAYFRDRLENIESSYWDKSLYIAKIDNKVYNQKFEEFEYSQPNVNSLLKSNPIFMLINNNEYVVINSFDDLFEVMRFIDNSYADFKEYNKNSDKSIQEAE